MAIIYADFFSCCIELHQLKSCLPSKLQIRRKTPR